MDVETLAVGKIQDMVARCARLKPIITGNDKTPFTDGHIDVYKKPGYKNSDWEGRVTVQVKGRKLPRGRRPAEKFSISRMDLIAFQKDSGVLYFVVSVDPDSARREPFYAALSPAAIEHMLGQIPETQKSVAVPLKKFPNEPGAIERIVNVALKTRSQRSSLGFDPNLFEKVRSITLHSTTDLKFDAPIKLVPGETDFALEAATESGMQFSLSGIIEFIPQEYTKQVRDVTISAGAFAYDQATVQRLDGESFEARLSEALTLIFTHSEAKRSLNATVSLKGNVLERLKAVEFFLGVFDGEQIRINDQVLARFGSVVGNDADFQHLREQLEYLRRLQELFDRLGIDGRLIDLDKIEEGHALNLGMLYRAFVEKQEVSNDADEITRHLVMIGKWAAMVFVVPGSSPGKWRYVDPFDPSAPHLFRWRADDNQGNEAIPVTVYDIVEQEHLPTVLNLHLEAIVAAYEAIAESAQTMTFANHKVLALILAADSCQERSEEFLNAAYALNEWLILHEGEQPHHLINRWQIAWRSRSLSDDVRDEIRALKRQLVASGASNAEEAELSCALLLGDSEDVDYLAHRLSAEKLDLVRTWPIWKLRGA